VLSIAGEAPRGNDLLAAGRLVTPQTAGDLVGDEVNLVTMGAVGDAYSFPDGTMAAASNTLSSQSATFLSTDVGKYICDTGAGNGSVSQGPQGTAITLCSTIQTFVSSHTVIVGFNATNPTPSVGSANATIVTPGTGYTPGDLVTVNISGAIGSNAAVQKIIDTQVVSASIASAGSGITLPDGTTCGLIGTTGTPRNRTNTPLVEVNVTTSGGSITGITKIVNAGDYTANPTEPEIMVPAKTPGTATGCTGLTPNSASLNLVLGALATVPNAYGAYPSITSGTYTTTDTSSSSGTGLTLAVSSDFPVSGIFTYGTDDSAPYKKAVDLVNLARSEGVMTLLYVPPGECSSGTTTTCSVANTGAYFFGPGAASDAFTNGGGIVTDGNYATTFYMSPLYAGTPNPQTGSSFQPLVWWLQNGSNAASFDGPAYAFSKLYSPSLTGGIMIDGDRTSLATQVGMAFCGSNYFAEIHDYQFRNLPGTGLLYGCTTQAVGSIKAIPQSHNRESRFYSIRGFNSGASPINGSPNYAAIDINTQNTDPKQTAGMDDVGFDNVELFGNHGNGIIIHAADVNGSIGFVDFTGRLRVEGLAPDGTPLQGNLIQIGDTNTAMDGSVHDISFPTGMQLTDPYFGYAGLLVTTSTTGTVNGSIPFDITTDPGTTISGGAPYGNGLDVDACSNCTFNVLLIGVDGYSYMQGNSTRTSGITLNLQPGNVANWTTLIDPTAVILQPATISSTGSIGSTTALAPPAAVPFSVTSNAITPAVAGSWSATSSETGTYLQIGALTCVDIVGTLNASNVTGASGALQFQLPVRPALGTHDVIGISQLSGGLVWPIAGSPAAQTTQAVFYPISNRTYGQIGFLGSTLNTPLTNSNLNVSSINVGTTYIFGFNGCYQ